MPLVKSEIGLSIIILSYKSRAHLEVLLPSVFGSEGVCFADEQTADKSASARAGRDGSARYSAEEPVEGQNSDKLLSRSTGSGNNNLPIKHYTAEVIVVDNGSQDGTIEWLNAKSYKLKAISNINNGFAAGNNLGIKQARGKYVLLLNPDTKVQPDTFRTMLDFMEARQDVGISGCKLIKPDGKLDLACRRRFPNPWNSFKRLFLHDNQNYNYTDVDEDQSMEVDSVVGAFLLIRKSVADNIGLLDEQFFMYGEDLDWCWRCKQAGYKVWYYPKTFITHYKGESSRKIPFAALKWFHDAMWVFYKKHYAAEYPFVFNWLVWLGIYGRMAALFVINLLKKERIVSK